MFYNKIMLSFLLITYSNQKESVRPYIFDVLCLFRISVFYAMNRELIISKRSKTGFVKIDESVIGIVVYLLPRTFFVRKITLSKD